MIFYQLRENKKFLNQNGKKSLAFQCFPWQLYMDTEWDITYSTAHIVTPRLKAAGISADSIGS